MTDERIKPIIVVGKYAQARKDAADRLVRAGFPERLVILWDGHSERIKGLRDCKYVTTFPLPDNWEKMEIELKLGNHKELIK